MAYGIEELAKMKVTGPVQGGDMVAKPNEMPVGAAALLNKMQKKNTPGIFKLPAPDKEMPSFMKVAAEGVEEQNTANLEDAEILRIMGTYGVSPEEARRIYDEMIYGYEREEAAIDPTDWRSILKMIESGMSQEEIDEQLAMYTVKDKAHKEAARVEAFAPEGHQLAYITPDEGEMLKMMGGSGDFNKMTGVQTFRIDRDDRPDADKINEANQARIAAKAQGEQRRYAGQTMADAGISGMAGGTTDTKAGKKAREIQRDFYTDRGQDVPDYMKDDPRYEDETKETIIDVIKDVGSKAGKLPFLPIKIADMLGDWAAGMEEKGVEKLIASLGTEKGASTWGNLLRRFQEDPDRGQQWFEDWGDKLGGEHKQTEWDDMKNEEKLEKLISMASAGGKDKFTKEYDPDTYWKENKPKTAQDYKDMAEAQRGGRLKFTKANTQAIEEGRRLLDAERQSGRDRHPGTGRGSPTREIEEIKLDENVEVDPRAGAFNVGGTMKYTDPTRTGGVAMDVPLGRRFEIDKGGAFRGSTPMDLSEAVKYATLGGYSQLEPFQEYLARRRKELGEQPDEWFDEEGNVIYSKQV
tara:strand:+ start:1737 stop:3476 length:1740 start_codon:yes stop_codon:yes gene_type:complete